jgi:hypothetical protein
MPYTNYTPQEVAARGEALYERQLRQAVETEHKGKFLVLDIETGTYEIDLDDLIATKRLLTRQPQAVIYGLRIGYPTAYCLGAHFASSAR